MHWINRKNLLLFSITAETVMTSYGLLMGNDAAIISVLYLAAGLVIVFTMLTMPEARLPGIKDVKRDWRLKLPVGLFMILLAYITARYWLDEIPLDPDFADMLPVMKVMNTRLLHGDWKQVYDPIPEIWNGVRPIYMPAMWIPYLPAIALHLDMRWVSVLAVLFGFAVILSGIRFRDNKYYGYFQLAILMILFWWIFSRNDVHSLISMSEEGVVIFYFIFLTLSIISGNAFLMGVASSLCLLSRYSMIGWLIPCLIFFAARKNFRQLIIFSATGAGCILLFFLFPFGFKVFEQMLKLPGSYVAFGKQVWENSPEVFWLNLGMAKFYGPHQMAALHQTLILLSFGIPLIFMCFCLLQKKWKLQNINLACFKLSLLVFFQFIDVPYGYLFYTCSFVSLVIAGALFNVQMGKCADVQMKCDATRSG